VISCAYCIPITIPCKHDLFFSKGNEEHACFLYYALKKQTVGGPWECCL